MPVLPMPRVTKTSNIANGEIQKAKMIKPATMVMMAGEIMKAHRIINAILGRVRITTVGAAISTIAKEG